jgi:methylated-DNA-[protein]-cysteine S-methyltransferase
MTKPQTHLREHRLPTAIGTVILLTDDQDVVRVLDFDDFEIRMKTLLDRHYGKNCWSINEAFQSCAALERLESYFRGDIAAIDTIKTATRGSVFQRQVWSALRDVRAGAPESYGALARRIGRPNAFRAVGLANGANPIGIIVPCHRIIGSTGALTGYGGGIARKRWLLEHEASHVPPLSSLTLD